MKFNRIISAFALALMLPSMAFAQDARQRTPQTIVADVLAEIPMAQRADFDTAMNDLLGTGSFGVAQLAKMLVPASQGENNRVEYALDGLVAYAGSHATPAQLGEICNGLAAAIDACEDNANKAFLITLLSRISRAEDCGVFTKYLDDPYLGEHAQSALILTPGTDMVVNTLIAENKLPHSVLARLAGAKHIADAEPALIGWLKAADSETAASIYRALAECGTVKSLPVLAKGAKNENYKWVSTDATAAYVSLLNRLAWNPLYAKAVAKDAKSLLNKKVNSNVRTGALTALFTAEGVKAAPVLYKAVADADRQYRVAALRQSEAWMNDEILARLGEIALSSKTPAEVKTDIVNWIGANKYDSQIGVVIDNIDSDDAELADACFKAASRMGGDRALNALAAQLAKEGPRGDKAYNALLSFNGDIKPSVLAMLSKDAPAQLTAKALRLASARRVREAAPRAMELLADQAMADDAYAALPGVVAPANIGDLCKLLETAPVSRRAQIMASLASALRQLPAAEQYAAIKPYFEASADKPLYYAVIAGTGAPEAVAVLWAAYNEPATRDTALDALLIVMSPEVIDHLYEIAVSNEAANSRALKRYALMVNRYGKDNIDRYNRYRRGIEVSKSADADNVLIERLATTGTYGALLIADQRIGNAATAAASAAAIRAIMTKHLGEYQGDEVRAAIVKAMDYYKAESAHDADAGYAVDDLKGMLAKYDALAANAVAPVSELTAEEKAQGFDMLFDGTSLKKWTGDTATYIIRDGCITVNAAHWGNNIYTADEYGDFVFRFEFALDRPGVNNGVGIRTPMNVDAAFHGMEIQILDHDDPMYADIAEYQVHGSVYGVIPAKRVKFKHGEWNTEEIRAEGDHITVTVNGKVILDGNIREACQGHAVGDPGEEGNHYMIDHRNHPGLFNKSGHIGFLGHGDGIRFRNVRILDLGK